MCYLGSSSPVAAFAQALRTGVTPAMTVRNSTAPHTGKSLNPAERALLDAVATGNLVDLRTGEPDLDNPANAAAWDAARNLRAEFLAELLTGDRTTDSGRLRAVKIRGARIIGPLDLGSGKLLCPLVLLDCCFGESVFLSEAEAPWIRLGGCHVPALIADGLRTAGGIRLDAGFTARGGVRLAGAHIGGQLDFSGSALVNENGRVLTASRITVGQDMFLSEGFIARGEVRMIGARVGGRLDLRGASLTCAALALDLEAANIRNLSLPRERPEGGIDLTNAQVVVLDDDQEGWPAAISMRGFAYDSLKNRDISTRARLQWLRRHPGRFTPQLYDQLADAYRRAGEDVSARKVLVAKQRRRRHPCSPLSWLWFVTVGYGYRTWQALIWVAALTVTGSSTFSGAYPAHMIAMTAHPPKFQPIIYTLDVLLPGVGLGQKSAWQPTTPGLLDWYWALTAAGWVLSAAVVAGLTGILKRD